MSTGYGWEGIRQVCATLLSVRNVPEHLCGGSASTWGAVKNVELCAMYLSASVLSFAFVFLCFFGSSFVLGFTGF